MPWKWRAISEYEGAFTSNIFQPVLFVVLHFLFQYHPDLAIDFFLKVLNHSSDWYAHPRVPDPLEPAREIELRFPNGAVRTQWSNSRLWNLYRGRSVGPSVIQSLLMAFEKGLLAYGKEYPKQLDALLVDVLRRSDSAMPAAVVASVATAYSYLCGEALLILLSAPEYIALDRGRMVGERGVSALSRMLPQFRSDNRIYKDEREAANRLPHRSKDLEAAISDLQLGPLAPRVHAILDEHLAALPPASEQNHADMILRLAIHRMDLRQYVVTETGHEGLPTSELGDNEGKKRYFIFEPKPPDSDLQEIVDESAANLKAMNERLGVLMWGVRAYRGVSTVHDVSGWRSKLKEAPWNGP